MFTNEENHFMLNDATYQYFKKLVQIVLPACSALYFGLAQIWGLPAAEQVVGTIALITTFLGLVLGVSASNYNKSGAAYDGDMVITDNPNGPKMFSLQIDGDPEELVNKDSIRFRVRPDEEDI